MLARILKSKWLTPAIAAFLVLTAVGLFKTTSQYLAGRYELKILGQKKSEAEKALAELQRTKELSGSESYLEQLARLKLNFKLPDEKVVFVYKNQYNSQTETPSPTASPAPGWWSSIVDWFKGK